MIIIALTGPKTVGKSTFAQTIRRVSDVPTAITSFADPVKQIANKLGFPGPPYEDKEKPVKRGLSCRDAWIGIGEGLRKSLYPEIWIDQMATEIEAHKTMGGSWKILIVDDLRQPDEAEWLRKEYNAYVVELEREGVRYGGGVLESPLPAHLVDSWVRLQKPEEGSLQRWNEAFADQVLRHAKRHYNPQQLKHGY